MTIEQTGHAFLFGCNVFLWGRVGTASGEQIYRDRFAALFNFATLPFYWPSYEPRRGRTDHARIAEIATWCRQQRIATKGHPLAWNYADPTWLPVSSSEIRDLQMARIDDCVSRFRSLISRWDVVNEATHFDRDELKRRAPKMTAMWAETGKVAFVQACFQHARRANPRATLLINDYRTDPAYESLLQELADERRRPIFDVVGIQSHMHGGTWSSEKLWDVCQRFARFGVPLHFTETTILSGQHGWRRGDSGQPWPSTAREEIRQAKEVEKFYTMAFSHPSVEALTWWDFADRGAWQRAPAGFLRQDLSSKPSYERLLELVKNRWWTRTTAVTDAAGRADFRGFLGDYRLRATQGGRSAQADFSLKPSQLNAPKMKLA